MMMQEIAPHTFSNHYAPKPPKADSPVMCFQKNMALVLNPAEGVYALPTVAMMAELVPDIADRCTYLFDVDGEACFCAEALPLPPQGKMVPLREPMNAGAGHIAFAIIVGYQLWNWYASRRFCGRCGQPMAHDAKERMMRCPSCGQMEFPKICPGVIVGVTHGDRLLMTRYAGRAFKNYALIAGFTEIGETLEETVHREVMEEVGLKVKNLRFYKSQPWPFSDSLLCGFFCDLDSSEDITLEEDELSEARWFDRADIPVELGGGFGSMTHEMIVEFAEGRA